MGQDAMDQNVKPWGTASYPQRRLQATWDSESEQSVYDATFYENDRRVLGAATPFVRCFFLRELGEWDSCIDLGCGLGLGLWMRALLDDGKDAWGVDFSDGARATNVLGDRYVHADLTQPLQVNRAFDVVTSWEVFEHLTRDVHGAYLDNIVALQPRLLILSCAGFRVSGRDTGDLDPPLEKQKGRHHHSCMTLRELAETITARGFELDGLRSCIWRQVAKVPRHYRQNTLVFCTPGSELS